MNATPCDVLDTIGNIVKVIDDVDIIDDNNDITNV